VITRFGKPSCFPCGFAHARFCAGVHASQKISNVENAAFLVKSVQKNTTVFKFYSSMLWKPHGFPHRVIAPKCSPNMTNLFFNYFFDTFDFFFEEGHEKGNGTSGVGRLISRPSKRLLSSF
jgi:hypothetical protein